MTTPKSGKVRAVPMAPDVATALAQLGDRENWVGDDDLVFVGGSAYLDGSALRRRYKAPWPRRSPPAPLPRPPPHVRHADDRQGRHPPRAGMDGPSDIQTTMQYLHYAPRAEDAQLVAEAFRVEGPDGGTPGTLRRPQTSPLKPPATSRVFGARLSGARPSLDPPSRARVGDAAASSRPPRAAPATGGPLAPKPRGGRRGTLGDAPGQHPRCVQCVAADGAACTAGGLQ